MSSKKNQSLQIDFVHQWVAVRTFSYAFLWFMSVLQTYTSRGTLFVAIEQKIYDPLVWSWSTQRIFYSLLPAHNRFIVVARVN